MRLNLGSSHPKGIYKTPEWVNFDYCHSNGIQVRGDALRLPFKNNSFEEIRSVHVLEHLTREKTLPVLKEALRVLAPGGVAFFEVPNFEQIVYLLADAFKRKNRGLIHIWKTSCFGKNERQGMAHYCGFDTEQMLGLMEAAGYKDVTNTTSIDKMISSHYLQEPVILVSGTK